jgi:hypothetical protein
MTTISFIFLAMSFIFAQEELTPEKTEETEKPQETVTSSAPQVQWLWGEVVSVDAQNKAISVKYFDYDNDIEKEISIGIDDKTTYENAKSIDEIKPQDSVSIDYTVTPEGKGIAKNISVEKFEGSGASGEEVIPGQLTPEGSNTESVPQPTE